MQNALMNDHFYTTSEDFYEIDDIITPNFLTVTDLEGILCTNLPIQEL